MKFEVLQKTRYQYSEPVKQSINKCIFKPLHDEKQQLFSYEQIILPKAESTTHSDYWGNEVVTFYIWEPHDFLEVQTRSVLEVKVQKVDVVFTADMEEEMQSAQFKEVFAEYLMETPYTMLSMDAIFPILETIKEDDDNPLQFVAKLNQYIYEHFSYVPGSTHVKTTAQEAYELRTGVCQDFTHIMLAICKSQGIPSRYVSGYIYSGEDVAMRGESMTHAWIEIYLPSYGWIGFDPTNDMIAQEQHISVAKGRDYADITPLKGVYLGNGIQELSVSIQVKAIQNEHETSNC